MKNAGLIRMLTSEPLALSWEKLQQIEAFLHYRMDGGPQVAYSKRPATAASVYGQVAIIPIMGSICQRMGLMEDMSGGTSTVSIAAQLRQAVADQGVKAIVLQIDSPGGGVYGVQELADQIYKARSQKRIVAVADSLAASAAYWIGASASEFSCTPSGEVGSVGVYAMHVDESGALEQEGVKVTYVHAGDNKVETNPAEPLTDTARSFMQQRVNEYYQAFVASVARGRGTNATNVRTSYGGGRVFGADQATKIGMIDRVATLDEVVAREQNRKRQANAPAAAGATHAAIASSVPSRKDPHDMTLEELIVEARRY